MILNKKKIKIFCFLLTFNFFKIFLIILKEFFKKIYSKKTFFINNFNLKQKINTIIPDIPVFLKELDEANINKLFNSNLYRNNTTEIKNLIECFLFAESEIPQGYVGYLNNETPIVICWMIDSNSNDKIKSYFNNSIPLLQKNEVLLEFIYTHPEYRGKKLMAWITQTLFKIAKNNNKTKAIAYIYSKNKLSLIGSKKIGWKLSGEKKVKWFFFKKEINYIFF